MKKFTYILSLGLCIFATSALAGNFNEDSKSYGAWVPVSSDFHDMHLDKTGVIKVKIENRNCKVVQEKKRITGKQLLADLNQSVEDASGYGNGDVDKSYANSIAVAYGLIKPAQNYTRITYWFDGKNCAVDGAEGFIRLTDKMALGVLSAPDDSYYLMRKK